MHPICTICILRGEGAILRGEGAVSSKSSASDRSLLDKQIAKPKAAPWTLFGLFMPLLFYSAGLPRQHGGLFKVSVKRLSYDYGTHQGFMDETLYFCDKLLWAVLSAPRAEVSVLMNAFVHEFGHSAFTLPF